MAETNPHPSASGSGKTPSRSKPDHSSEYFERATLGITTAIDKACRARTWSLSRLGEELGIAQNTILRWKKGGATRIEVAHLIQVFDWARASMDEAFGLGQPAEGEANKELMRLRNEIENKRNEIEAIRSQHDKVVAELLERISDLRRRI